MDPWVGRGGKCDGCSFPCFVTRTLRPLKDGNRRTIPQQTRGLFSDHRHSLLPAKSSVSLQQRWKGMRCQHHGLRENDKFVINVVGVRSNQTWFPMMVNIVRGIVHREGTRGECCGHALTLCNRPYIHFCVAEERSNSAIPLEITGIGSK